MKIARKRMTPVTETQMISLADIAFLIIFFFMLTSSFMRDHTDIDLPTLAATNTSEADITVSVSKSGQISIRYGWCSRSSSPAGRSISSTAR